MIKNQNPKRRILCLHPFVIAAGMYHPVLVFVATMIVAVRRGEWFSEACNLHGVGELLFVTGAESFPNIL